MMNEQKVKHGGAEQKNVGLPENESKRRFGLRGERVPRRRSLRYRIGAVCVLLCLLMLLIPSPFVIESAGPTQDVLGQAKGKQVISVSGVRQYPSRGRLLLLTVNAEGVPGYETPVARVLPALLDSSQEVLPSEAVFPPGQDGKQYLQESKKQMSQSQDASTHAGLAFAKSLGIDTSKAKVSMHVDDIGGPSAGMMYSLGIINKLTKQDETGGKSVAGTGTINNDGKVGSIGGIRLKMIGAKRDGATWFLAPQANCDEVVGHVPSGLRVVRVSTLDEAYGALVAIGKGSAGSLPSCSAGGAE